MKTTSKVANRICSLFLALSILLGMTTIATTYAASKTFKIVFSPNGGTGTMKTQVITYGTSTALTANAYKKTAYHFDGWMARRSSDKYFLGYNSSGTRGWYPKSSIVTYYKYADRQMVAQTVKAGSSATLYAQWAINTFNVVYNANGGTGSMASQTVTYGTAINTTPNAFTRDGYTFTGWHNYRDHDNSWYYTNGTKTGWYVEGSQPVGYYKALRTEGVAVSKTTAVHNATVTFYAQWKANPVVEPTTPPTTEPVAELTTVPTTVPTTEPVAELTTVPTTVPTTESVAELTTAPTTAPTTEPVAESTTAPTTEPVTEPTTVPTTAPTISAGTQYTVVYNGNGATGGSMANSVFTTGVASTLSPNKYTLKGYKFGGWYAYRDFDNTYYGMNSAGAPGWYSVNELSSFCPIDNGATVSKLAPSGTVTLTMNWTPIKFTVKYDIHGGTGGSMTDQEIEYHRDEKAKYNEFYRTGYGFNGYYVHRLSDDKWYYVKGTTYGWYRNNSQPSGYAKVRMAEKGKLDKLSTVDGDTVVLLAAWSKGNVFTVTYNANGGTGTMQKSVIKYGVTSVLNECKFERSGYIFGGWYGYSSKRAKWRYEKNGKLGWYKKGSQPSGYTLYRYNNGQKVTSSVAAGDTLKLYAVWIADGFNAIPAYEGGRETKRTYSAGQGIADSRLLAEKDSTMRMYTNTTTTEFKEYLTKLRNNGYKEESFNEIDNNLYACYYNGKNRIYTYFTGSEKATRVILDKTSTCSTSEFSYGKKGTGSTVLYQYALNGDGMLYIYKLSDNSIFIIDGGHYKRFSDTASKELMNFLRQITGISSGKITISCWFISHFHSDHGSGIIRFYNQNKSNLILKRVAGNPAGDNEAGFFQREQSYDYINFINRIKSYFGTNIPFLKLHTGQVFEICGVSSEVLSTHEDLVDVNTGRTILDTDFSAWNAGDFNESDYNNVSVVLKMTFDGKTFFVTGDINRPVMYVLFRNFSDATFKSDIVQIAHHILNDVNELYIKTKSFVAFYPTSKARTISKPVREKNNFTVNLFNPQTFLQENLISSAQVVNGKIEAKRVKTTDNVTYDGWTY